MTKDSLFSLRLSTCGLMLKKTEQHGLRLWLLLKINFLVNQSAAVFYYPFRRYLFLQRNSDVITRDPGSYRSASQQASPGNSVRLKSYLSSGRCHENPSGDINGVRSPLNSISIRLMTGSFRTSVGSQEGGILIKRQIVTQF